MLNNNPFFLIKKIFSKKMFIKIKIFVIYYDMLELHIFQLLFFVTYMLYVYFLCGVIPSISDSYYALGKKGILFLFFCLILGFSYVISPLGEKFLFFLSGAGLVLTGVASEFRSNIVTTRIVHNVSAISSILFSFLGQIIYYDLWWPFILSFTFLIISLIFKIKNIIWWVEIVSIILIFVGFALISY
jgi:hypothetical protein